MPWVIPPKSKEKHHFCKTPRWIFWWRKDRDLWGCPECGYIWKLVKPGYMRKQKYSWDLEDSRGWSSPYWNYHRRDSVSRADEKKMITEEWERQQN